MSELFPMWAVLELMGHRRLAGLLSEVSVGGASMLRIDIPAGEGGPAVTQFYGGSSVYAITPVSEETARAVAVRTLNQPVTAYEVPRLPAPERRWQCFQCGNKATTLHKCRQCEETFCDDCFNVDAGICTDCEEGPRADDCDGLPA